MHRRSEEEGWHVCRTPNAIDSSQGSFRCPSNTDTLSFGQSSQEGTPLWHNVIRIHNLKMILWQIHCDNGLKASAHFLNVIFRDHYSKYLSLSMHLLPRMKVMLDFIWTLPVQLTGTRNKWTLQKILFTVGFWPQNGMASRLQVDRLYHSVNSPMLRVKELNSM